MGDRRKILEVSAEAFGDEAQAVTRLLNAVEPLAALEGAVMARATAWVKDIRTKSSRHDVEHFLHTYGLDTREGVALMCLAEALLRIPDAQTADRLIHDTFGGKDWLAPVEKDESWLMHASGWGLLLTGKMVDAQENIGGVLQQMAQRLGEPVIRETLKAAMRFIGAQFVLGETVEDALEHSKPWTKKGFRFSYDILGEGARSDAQAQAYVKAYRDAIARIGKTSSPGESSLSVKLSALHPRYSLSKEPRMMGELLPRLKEILLLARQHQLTVSIDAEEANRLDIELALFEKIIADADFSGWNGIGFVVQAYQKRAIGMIGFLEALAHKHKKTIPVRLVKGAYWDSEIKQAQIYGLPGYPVFTRKEHTDVSYLACAMKLLAAADCFYPQFATHNARTVASIQLLAQERGIGNNAYEFQRLHGMGEALHDKIATTHVSRIYAPIGKHKDLLAYLIRRLLENGANTSFVNLLMDEGTPLSELLADPVAATKAQGGSAAIVPPAELYGTRKNSSGTELGYLAARDALLKDTALHDGSEKTLRPRTIDSDTLKKTIAQAKTAFPAWAETPVDERCLMLEKAADLLEKRRAKCIAILIREGGKTIPDAISEVREAADFCRYYAQQARLIFTPQNMPGPTGEENTLTLHPRGVFACISPWNFPLAIFTGQVVAALAAGNCAIAKPAEPTPVIARLMVDMLHEAGVPKHVVQLAHGGGSTVGAALVSDTRIDGVVFTGSVAVAQAINRALASRDGAIVPFIAETGGINCMVVDSSALPEAAIDDIILSAFASAGQRCSALRVLYVQDDIADELLALLSGAMAELALGDPMQPDTDIGPVIDEKAQASLMQHIERMKHTATLVAACPAAKITGHFVPPHAFEIGSIDELPGEVFGPVLHVIRFKADAMQQVANAINSTGFGLTFGIHSRVEENIEFFISRIRAGNIYVNRSQIGAVVGVQPFGGEGLSGTGPKAGGPHYLPKFATERTVSVNTAAIGGNLALLAGEN